MRHTWVLATAVALVLATTASADPEPEPRRRGMKGQRFSIPKAEGKVEKVPLNKTQEYQDREGKSKSKIFLLKKHFFKHDLFLVISLFSIVRFSNQECRTSETTK